jgi:imidazolonepropionase-like amidohydrolase
MHTHIGVSDGLLQIAAGVTSVRDLANNHDELVTNIKSFDQGMVIGPHVYKAGFIDQKSPFSAPTGKLAENLEQALEYVDWYAERGYPQIKIYSSITPAWVRPMAKRIHKHGMKLSGHIPSFMKTEQAVKDGYDEIQHINMLFLNFLAGAKDDTRTPIRFTLVGEKAGDLDLDSKQVQSFIQLLKQKQVVVDPTVTIFHSMFLNKSGKIDPSYTAIADHLPANVRRGFLTSILEINDDNETQYKKSAQALLIMIKKLHEAGIQLVAGTDAIAGFTLHRELELYVQAGISTADVIKIATIESAKVANQEKTTGSIAIGKAADLVLVDGNPLTHIADIRKVIWTIKGNKKYNASELYQSIGIKPFTSY